MSTIVLALGLLLGTGHADAETAAPKNANIGTIAAIDGSGTVTFLPWRAAPADVKTVRTDTNTMVLVGKDPAKVADLRAGNQLLFEDSPETGLLEMVICR